jgi:two-component system sensor histidine kinase PilS (NtrC family)
MISRHAFWRHGAARLAGAWDADPAQGAFSRLWHVFMGARVAIAGVLVALQSVFQALGSSLHDKALAVCIAYLCATLAVQRWARPQPPRSAFDAQWICTIGADVLAFSLLNFLQSSAISYTPLFALPVLLASVLGPIVLAFGTAASVTLLLLANAWWNSAQGAGDVNARWLQAGLSGTGFFLVALLANQLALRLAREERLLKQSESAARTQTEVNELVVAALADGVLVVDDTGMVRSANPAARRLLAADGDTYPIPFRLAAQVAWQPLGELMQRTFTLQAVQQAGISLAHPGLNARRLHARSRLTASKEGPHGRVCVIFLEDLREMEARIRIEKLAAMGRMSAAVAHEIRNPLAAISQANALLEEDLQDAGQQVLTDIIGQNAQRLAKIVDEVLNISRAQQQIPAPQAMALRLDEAAGRIASDWARQNGAAGQLRISTGSGNAAVRFDEEHLRRLLINLLDNALRYMTPSPDALQVSTQLVAPGQARLAVWSDGQPLEASVEVHLFEPFFSSESRSSGLGLFICRELCERYGALIGYQRVPREGTQGNEFFVMFQPASQFLSADLSGLDSVLV